MLNLPANDGCRCDWRPALSWQLAVNGVREDDAVFDSPPATAVEQRPLERPVSPRRWVQRWRWSCPRRRRASSFYCWCAKSGDDPCPKRSGGRLFTASATWVHETATVFTSSMRRSGRDAWISATMVDTTTIFGRTARTRSKEPMQPAHTFLTALARFAQCTGFYERCSRPSSSDGAVTSVSMMAAMSRISLQSV